MEKWIVFKPLAFRNVFQLFMDKNKTMSTICLKILLKERKICGKID